jgi:hypothetical protein
MFPNWCRAFEEALRVQADARPGENAATEAMANLRLDYQTTVQQFTTLADIRFKLLAFVPAVTGAAFGLLKDSPNNAATAAIGIFGFLVTLGIVFYEIRNTQFYNCAVHRAKALEACLKLTLCTAGREEGGFFCERPRDRLYLFCLIEIWHDRGFAIVYGSTLAAWALLVFHAMLASLAGWSLLLFHTQLASQTGQRYFALIVALAKLMTALAAGVIGFIFGSQMIRLSEMDKPKRPADPCSTPKDAFGGKS